MQAHKDGMGSVSVLMAGVASCFHKITRILCDRRQNDGMWQTLRLTALNVCVD